MNSKEKNKKILLSAMIFYSSGAKLERTKEDNDKLFGKTYFYISIPENVLVTFDTKALSYIKSHFDNVNEVIKTKNGIMGFVKERLIDIISYDFQEDDFDEDDLRILDECIKVYIKIRKGERLDQKLYEKNCKEFCDNIKKIMDEYCEMSEYIEV